MSWLNQIHRTIHLLAALLLGVLLAACSPDPVSTPADSASVPVRGNAYHLDEAQPELNRIKLWLGPHEISVEIASKNTEIATGMMFRQSLGANEGMLFVFPQAGPRSFYMKNTVVPLTCAYIDPEGKIEEIHDMQPLDESPIPSKSHNIQYVLEMNQGWFEKNGIGPGVLISTEKGTMGQTFFPFQNRQAL